MKRKTKKQLATLDARQLAVVIGGDGMMAGWTTANAIIDKDRDGS